MSSYNINCNYIINSQNMKKYFQTRIDFVNVKEIVKFDLRGLE